MVVQEVKAILTDKLKTKKEMIKEIRSLLCAGKISEDTYKTCIFALT